MALGIMYFDEGYATAYKRDYMMGRLYHPLEAGRSYCVTFYANMSESAGYAVNHIGAYFDDGSIDTFSQCGYPHPGCVPQVVSAAVIDDSVNWVKIQGSFTANGTERYMTIGNFYDTAHITAIFLTGAAYSYYLIDDVSVIASDATAQAGPDITIALGDSTYIGVDSNGDGMPCYWYTLSGTSPIDSGGRILVKPAATTTYVVMMDLCGHITYDTVTVIVAPENTPVLINLNNVQVYPNPARDELHVSGLQQNTAYRLLGVTGSSVQSGILQRGGNAIPVQDVIPGTYLLELTGAYGEKKVARVIKE